MADFLPCQAKYQTSLSDFKFVELFINFVEIGKTDTKDPIFSTILYKR